MGEPVSAGIRLIPPDFLQGSGIFDWFFPTPNQTLIARARRHDPERRMSAQPPSTPRRLRARLRGSSTAGACPRESGGLCGFDAGRKINGRKRQIGTITHGLTVGRHVRSDGLPAAALRSRQPDALPGRPYCPRCALCREKPVASEERIFPRQGNRSDFQRGSRSVSVRLVGSGHQDQSRTHVRGCAGHLAAVTPSRWPC